MHLNFKITTASKSSISLSENRVYVSNLFNYRHYSGLFNRNQDMSGCNSNGHCISYCFNVLFVVNPIFL